MSKRVIIKSDFIKRLREKTRDSDTGKPYSQEALAFKLETSQYVVSQLESNPNYMPGLRILSNLARFYGLKVDDIIIDTTVKQREPLQLRTNLIKKLREEKIDKQTGKPCTRIQLAVRLDASEHIVSQLESNPTFIPELRILSRLVRFYKVKIYDLIIDPSVKQHESD